MKEYPSKYRAPERRFDRGNRQFENPQYIGQNTNQRKKFTSRKNDVAELLNELFKKAAPELKMKLDDISASQKRLADAEERKAAALEKIAARFHGSTSLGAAFDEAEAAVDATTESIAAAVPGSKDLPKTAPEDVPEPESEVDPLPPKHTLAPAENDTETLPPSDPAPVSPAITKATDAQRKRVFEIVQKMHRKKATYNQIALCLEEENLPTFSGRGKWHAQTIHRLLKK